MKTERTQLFFDIETAGLPEPVIRKLMPEFQAPANYVDAIKIARNIAKQEEDWIESAALSPLTGYVLCVGIKTKNDSDNFLVIEHPDEAMVLQEFWDYWCAFNHPHRLFIGFSIKSFDLPFLIRRSWAHDVDVPKDVLFGRRWNERIVDLQEVWGCAGRNEYIGLEQLSQFLGLGKKLGSGADFASLWESDKGKAIEYLANDINLTESAYLRMRPWVPAVPAPPPSPEPRMFRYNPKTLRLNP